MYGYDETELVGQNIGMLIGGHDRMRHEDYVSQHIARPVKRLFRRTVEGEGVRRDAMARPSRSK